MDLYIYMVGRSCPARKYFYKPNILGHLDLTQNWGGPVKLVRGTGQTGARRAKFV
jgi:hypothetical protein